MSALEETHFVERLQFFNGQRLFAPDLQGIEAFNREMRWLHNQSLHQPGIGSGFAVYGKKGDREVTIGPGYTIDVNGREIVLTHPQVEPVPPVSGEDDAKPVFYDLTVSYPDDSELEEAETREGVCLPRGVVRLQEAPVFCWVRLKKDAQGNLSPQRAKLKRDIQDGLKIRLARAEVLNCQLNQPVSIAERRSARPARLPYIASGVAKLTDVTGVDVNLNNTLADFLKTNGIGLFALRKTVDTTEAGFLTTPCYSANIPGRRILKIHLKDSNKDVVVVILDEMHVQDTQPNGFTIFLLGLFAPSKNAGDPRPRPTEVAEQIQKEWHIVWMGVEG